MAMQVGEKIPDVKLKVITGEGETKEISTRELFQGKKAVLFAVPGAFTPTCSAKHLPGYVNQLEELRGRGVQLVACLSVNDAFVMEAWAKDKGALGKIVMIADGSANFTRAAGLELDLQGAGLGMRSKRWAAILEDGVVKSLDIDEKGLESTACEAQIRKA